MQWKKISITLLLSISLILVFFTSSFSSVVYDKGLYDEQHEKNDVYSIFGKETADIATDNLISFFKEDEKLGDFFGEDEKSHLEDVKILFNKTFSLLYISLMTAMLSLIYLIWKKEYKSISSGMIISGIFTIAIVLFFYIAQNNFSQIFQIFHKLFFTGNYTFDPAESNMINLLPQSFFLNMAYIIFSYSIIKGLVSLVLGIGLKYYSGVKKTANLK